MKDITLRVVVVVGLTGALPWLAPAEPAVGGCPGAEAGSRGSLNGSKNCLSCHDGTAAPDVFAGQASLRAYSQEGNHPVMISFAQAYARDPGEFFPPQLVNSSVKLVDGEIHCVSCHMVSSAGQWSLVKPNNHGELCLSCHRK